MSYVKIYYNKKDPHHTQLTGLLDKYFIRYEEVFSESQSPRSVLSIYGKTIGGYEEALRYIEETNFSMTGYTL